jgi:hypothetical protein
VKPLIGLHSNGRLRALPTNINLEWNQMEGANTLAYYATEVTTVVKVLWLNAIFNFTIIKRCMVS